MKYVKQVYQIVMSASHTRDYFSYTRCYILC